MRGPIWAVVTRLTYPDPGNPTANPTTGVGRRSSRGRSSGTFHHINDAISVWRDNGWGDLSPKTARHYESVWKVDLSSSIGRRKIVSLSLYDIERFYRSLKEYGLSQAGVRQVKAVLHRSLRLAQKWSRGALHNPAADADLPAWRLEERRDEVRAPEVAAVRTLLVECGAGRQAATTSISGQGEPDQAGHGCCGDRPWRKGGW